MRLPAAPKAAGIGQTLQTARPGQHAHLPAHAATTGVDLPLWSAGFRIKPAGDTPSPMEASRPTAEDAAGIVAEDSRAPSPVRLQDEQAMATRPAGGGETSRGRATAPACCESTRPPSSLGGVVTASSRSTWGGAVGEADEVIMSDIDVEEQRRILRDIERRRTAGTDPRSPRAMSMPSLPVGTKRGPTKAAAGRHGTDQRSRKKAKVGGGSGKLCHSGGGKQQSIASMFSSAATGAGGNPAGGR